MRSSQCLYLYANKTWFRSEIRNSRIYIIRMLLHGDPDTLSVTQKAYTHTRIEIFVRIIKRQTPCLVNRRTAYIPQYHSHSLARRAINLANVQIFRTHTTSACGAARVHVKKVVHQNFCQLDLQNKKTSLGDRLRVRVRKTKQSRTETHARATCVRSRRAVEPELCVHVRILCSGQRRRRFSSRVSNAPRPTANHVRTPTRRMRKTHAMNCSTSWWRVDNCRRDREWKLLAIFANWSNFAHIIFIIITGKQSINVLQY